MSQELTSNWKVEASDGSYYYYQAYDIGEVRDKFNESHPNLEILTIYLEVYGGQI